MASLIDATKPESGSGANSSDLRNNFSAAKSEIEALQGLLADRVTLQESIDAAPVQSVAGRSGAVVLAKADVGLGNVDNTADSAKPVSTAQQTALNAKVSIHAHNTQAGLSVAVVSVLPASPAAGVLYIVTSGG